MAIAQASQSRFLPGNGERRFASVRPITLLIVSGIIISLGIMAAAGFAAMRLRWQTLATAQTELVRLNLVLAEQTDRSFEAVDLMLKHMIEGMQARDLGSEDDFVRQMSGRTAQWLLKEQVSGIPEVDALILIGADGRVINSSRHWPAPAINVAGNDYFRALSGDATADKVYVSAPLLSATDNVMKIYLARRFNGPHGEFLGLVLGAIRVDYFEDFYRAIALGPNSSVSLTRTDATLLARYPVRRELLGRRFTGGLFDQLHKSGEGVVRAPSPIDGRFKLKSIHSVAHYPVAVLVTRARYEVLTAWRRQSGVLAAAAIFGMLGVAFLVLVIVRKLRIDAALTAARAEKIEAEHARITIEAELLKRERLSVLGQLTATVAHELRNPLSAIRNTLFSIKEIAAGAGVRLDRPVARMERSIARCDSIIGDLLEYTKTRELRRSSVVFDRWLDDVLNDMHVVPGIEIGRELGAAEAVVALDPDRVRRVVINLIDNAAQALGEPAVTGQDKRITVTTHIVGDAVELVVADSGPGIPAENLARIFEPLFSTKSFGTGLGLATVRQIVIQHDGSIDIDSTVGIGTRVVVRLPLGQEARAAA